jgi:hypothetical protein
MWFSRITLGYVHLRDKIAKPSLSLLPANTLCFTINIARTPHFCDARAIVIRAIISGLVLSCIDGARLRAWVVLRNI